MVLGTFREDPLTCDEADYHLPGCYNILENRTWCICGEEVWEGEVGTWHSRPIRYAITSVEVSPRVTDYRMIGWDVYFLPEMSSA